MTLAGTVAPTASDAPDPARNETVRGSLCRRSRFQENDDVEIRFHDARAVPVTPWLATSASPALARGKMDRAREAVAAARAKVDAAAKVSATGDVPRLQAEAAAALRTAEDDVASSRKDEAIAPADRASAASRHSDRHLGAQQRRRRQCRRRASR